MLKISLIFYFVWKNINTLLTTTVMWQQRKFFIRRNTLVSQGQQTVFQVCILSNEIIAVNSAVKISFSVL